MVSGWGVLRLVCASALGTLNSLYEHLLYRSDNMIVISQCQTRLAKLNTPTTRLKNVGGQFWQPNIKEGAAHSTDSLRPAASNAENMTLYGIDVWDSRKVGKEKFIF